MGKGEVEKTKQFIFYVILHLYFFFIYIRTEVVMRISTPNVHWNVQVKHGSQCYKVIKLSKEIHLFYSLKLISI